MPRFRGARPTAWKRHLVSTSIALLPSLFPLDNALYIFPCVLGGGEKGGG